MPYQNFPYPDGGMNEAMPAHLIPENQFAQLDNYWYNRGNKLVSRPGTEFIKRFTEPVWGVGCMATIGSSVCVQSGSVLYGRSAFVSSSAWTAVKTGVVSGYRFFANMNSAIYSGSFVGSSTADNLKWDPTLSAAVTIPGSPPALSYLCTWNSRMWGVHRTERTKLYYSKVGDPDDWTATGVSGAGFIDIGYSDGEDITGLVAHNEQLFVLKERSIWHIITANPNTDNSGWRVEVVTHNFGCTNHRGVVVAGNDVIIPSSAGYVSLNAALYQGDFKVASASQPIVYSAGGNACYSYSTDEYLYCVPWRPEREIYKMLKHGQTIKWMKMTIRDTLGNKLVPWLVVSGFSPVAPHPTPFYPGPFIYGTFSLIVVIGAGDSVNGANYDLLQYPATYQGTESHYDYIDGPEGAIPIRKYWKSRMYNFGNFGYPKRSRQAIFTYSQNDRDTIIDGDTMTFAAIFDGNDNYKKQEKIITDVGTEVMGPEGTVQTGLNRSPIRTAVIGLGGAQGQIYKGVQYELTNEIGGYELQYEGLETDYEPVSDKPANSEKVLT